MLVGVVVLVAAGLPLPRLLAALFAGAQGAKEQAVGVARIGDVAAAESTPRRCTRL